MLGLVLFSIAIAFNPTWWVLTSGGAVLVIVFVTARLPRTVIAPPPPAYFFVVGTGGIFALLSGGDPTLAGVGLGGLLDFVQLLVVGLLLIGAAVLLVWTTPPVDVGAGVARMLGPLRFLRVPVDELRTTVLLTVRCIPLVGDEVRVAVDARRSRPRPSGRGRRGGLRLLRDIVRFGAAIVVSSHRRAHELSLAMLARGSVVAPEPEQATVRANDVVIVVAATAYCMAVFVLA